MTNYHTATVAELSHALHSKKVSSVELTRHFLDRIAAHDRRLNSFITVTTEQALAAAAEADRRIAAGQAGPLTGIPLAQKDIFCTEGVRTSCASRMLDNFIAPYDATTVQRLNAAGMVMLGKTNMDEFAMGSSNETSYYGPVRNPWDLDRVPGGSSGGSAAAVAARLAPIATGTDTGGSIRQPAALCGLTGLKPTYGLVSRYGMIAFASSLDQAGPIAQSAEDAALLLQALAGFDPRDSTSLDRHLPDYRAALDNSDNTSPLVGVRIGVPQEYFGDGLSKGVHDAIAAAIAAYRKLGAETVDITLPNTRYAVPAYYVVAPAECSSNLSRFDGVRFGHRCQDAVDLMDLYKRSRGEGFGAEVKRRIMVGTYVLSAGYYDAYYLQAQKVRRLISDDFRRVFDGQQVDVILGPTAPTTAFRLNDKTSDPLAMYLSDIYTIAVNLAGLPALSMPVRPVEGLPVGLQLIGNYFSEAQLLNVAHQYQRVTTWHRQIPQAYAK
ncbi:MAG: Asp-tRNA(Asn)/Glu-tRNA(Gln) amidotransferase subunit GatA [Gammaproteobacteria bacterium]|nr:Asp-tRNA(Asn)/Glu-tRNA(Gln) amidotransferase subunit GatA [Gammaproteobacteria bacterium]